MRVKETWIALLISVFILFFIILAFVLYRNNQKASFQCDQFKTYFGNIDCGYQKISASESNSNIIIGIVEKKYIKDDVFFIDILTKDSKGRAITEKIALPQKDEKMGLTQATINSTNQVREASTVQAPSKVFSLLQEREEIKLDFYLLSAQEIDQLKKDKNTNKEFLNCQETYKNFVSFLKTSNIINWIKFNISKAQSKCSITTWSVGVLS